VNGKQRSQDGAINDYHDDSIELKSESSISVRPVSRPHLTKRYPEQRLTPMQNQTRHAPINPNTVQVEITITNDITNQLNDPPQPGLEHPSPRQAEPSAPDHDPTEALDVASYSSRTWKEVRNPAPANRVIAGMGAGLVGVMVVFTVFL
jgi:hypothetical protein